MHTHISLIGKIILFAVAAMLYSNAFAANYPLEIISPRAGLDTTNRLYKAYPGLVYDVRAAVIGGAYPFRYQLTTAPAGMSINAETGQIVWSNPTTAGSPHTVTLRVTDQENTSTAVTWTVTVTTAGFKFIDAARGKSAANGGTGTIDNPWQSIRDMYEGNDYASKSKKSYANHFVYFRNGTYVPNGYIEDLGRMPLTGNAKPQVWLAYPGEKPVLDMSGAMIAIYSGGRNTYIDGFILRNMSNAYHKGIQISSNANDVTLRRNHFQTLPTSDGSKNQSAVMRGASGKGYYFVMQDNEFSGFRHAHGVLGYDSDKVLMENNTLHDFNEASTTHGISPKTNNSRWSIRGNRFYNMNTAGSIWVDTYSRTGDIEISFNNINDSGKPLWIGQENVAYGKMYSLRNTYVGGKVEVSNLTADRGPVSFTRDVIVNESTAADHITDSSGRVVKNGVLSGRSADGVVDANGLLTDKYASYRGTHGHQISSQRKPVAPVLMSVQ